MFLHVLTNVCIKSKSPVCKNVISSHKHISSPFYSKYLMGNSFGGIRSILICEQFGSLKMIQKNN